MTPAWMNALRWLCRINTTTSDQTAQLQTYFEANADQLEVADHGGRLPLHDAAANQRGEHALSVVTALLKAYPHAARQKNNDGCLPLHCAAQDQKGEYAVAVVMALFNAYPAGAQEKDSRYGRLPLHFAARFQTEAHGVAVVTALLNAYPSAAQQADDRHGDLPADAALDNTDLTPACLAMLRAAAGGGWQSPPGAQPLPVQAARLPGHALPHAGAAGTTASPPGADIDQCASAVRSFRLLKE